MRTSLAEAVRPAITKDMLTAGAIALATHSDGGGIDPGSSLLTQEVIDEWMSVADAVLTAALRVRPIDG